MIADALHFNSTGTVQSRPRFKPLPRLCRATSSVSYRGVIIVLHSLLTLYAALGSRTMVVLKGKNRAPQRCPRGVLRWERQGGYDRRTGVLGPCSYFTRVTKPRK